MQSPTQDTLKELNELVHAIKTELTANQYIFKAIMQYVDGLGQHDPDPDCSKKMAKVNSEFILEFANFSNEIEALKTKIDHPIIAELEDLEMLATFLVTLMVCISEIGADKTIGAPSMGEWMIRKSIERIDNQMLDFHKLAA